MQQLPYVSGPLGTLACKLSVSELLLHALVIELEAVQRYQELSQMMEQTGNRKVAKLFAKMSLIEAAHAATTDEHIKGRKSPMLTLDQYLWPGLETSENTDSGRRFHLMTPCVAMSLALENERRACEFFANVVDDSTDECVREIAANFVVEEEQHIAWVEAWLAEEMAANDH